MESYCPVCSDRVVGGVPGSGVKCLECRGLEPIARNIIHDVIQQTIDHRHLRVAWDRMTGQELAELRQELENVVLKRLRGVTTE